MTDWGNNAFRLDLGRRLADAEQELSGIGFDLDPEADEWLQRSVPDLCSAPVLLQGRRLVVDVDDRGLTLYPLGLAGRFRVVAGFSMEAGRTDAICRVVRIRPGSAVVEGDGWRLTVVVAQQLPVVELSLEGAEGAAFAQTADGDVVTLDGATFHTLKDTPNDEVIARNNSSIPDPLPLDDLQHAGVLGFAAGGRIVLTVAAGRAEAAAALAGWEQNRADDLGVWTALGERLSVQLPDPRVSRQFRYSVHNSLFSRSVDDAGLDIFVHGRRDRGYADAAHLHQSYQMHLPALAAGESSSVRDELIAFCRLQDASGWIERAPRPVRGSSRYVGRYTSSHLLMAAERYLAWTGDRDLFARPVRSVVDQTTRTLAERVDAAGFDLLDHRVQGLAVPCGWADAWNPNVLAQGQASAAAVLGLRAWARASRALGRNDNAAHFTVAADEIADSITQVLLDPETGIVAEHLFSHGREGGTREDFWAHTQIWCALAGVLPDARALDLVWELCFRNGASIAPESAFDTGYIAESTDSNASLPLESTATWLLATWPEVTHLLALAEIERGQPDRALEAVRAQLPERLHELSTACAPYYYAEKYLYPGDRPWLCTWAGDPMLTDVVLTGFLGVRPSVDGVLRVTPSLPRSWRGATASATFVWMGVRHELEVQPDFDGMVVDGVRVPGCELQPPSIGVSVRRIQTGPSRQSIS